MPPATETTTIRLTQDELLEFRAGLDGVLTFGMPPDLLDQLLRNRHRIHSAWKQAEAVRLAILRQHAHTRPRRDGELPDLVPGTNGEPKWISRQDEQQARTRTGVLAVRTWPVVLELAPFAATRSIGPIPGTYLRATADMWSGAPWADCDTPAEPVDAILAEIDAIAAGPHPLAQASVPEA